MDALLSALPLVADPSVLLAIVVGSLIGLVFGSIPGLTYSLALAVVLPMTFMLPTVSAEIAIINARNSTQAWKGIEGSQFRRDGKGPVTAKFRAST